MNVNVNVNMNVVAPGVSLPQQRGLLRERPSTETEPATWALKDTDASADQHKTRLSSSLAPVQQVSAPYRLLMCAQSDLSNV